MQLNTLASWIPYLNNISPPPLPENIEAGRASMGTTVQINSDTLSPVKVYEVISGCISLVAVADIVGSILIRDRELLAAGIIAGLISGGGFWYARSYRILFVDYKNLKQLGQNVSNLRHVEEGFRGVDREFDADHANFLNDHQEFEKDSKNLQTEISLLKEQIQQLDAEKNKAQSALKAASDDFLQKLAVFTKENDELHKRLEEVSTLETKVTVNVQEMLTHNKQLSELQIKLDSYAQREQELIDELSSLEHRLEGSLHIALVLEQVKKIDPKIYEAASLAAKA